MKIVITGGAGFIGSNLVRLALQQGHKVLNVDKLTYAGNKDSLRPIEGRQSYQFIQADICHAEAIKEAFDQFRPNAVMHLAAESHVDRSIEGPMDFVQTNVVGTVTLLQVATDYWKSLTDNDLDSFRFLHVSTDEVYGSLGDIGAFSETTSYDPHSPYSASKASSDHFVRAWHDTYGLPVLISNCSNNYGPYQFPEKLIPVVILKAINEEPIPVYGQGENIRDWLYVEDHAEALLNIVKNGREGESYNIGGGNELRNIDLVRLLCEILDEFSPRQDGLSYTKQITFVEDRPGHDLRYAIDARKIREELGWTPNQEHQSGFRKTVQWYLDNKEWWESILNGSYKLDRLGVFREAT